MIVKEFLQQVDIDRQVDLICEKQADYEKPYDRIKVKEIQQYFTDKLQSIEPIQTEEKGIIVFEKLYDTDLDDTLIAYVSGEYYHKEDLDKYLQSIKDASCPILEYDENSNSSTLRELCYKFSDFPIGYAYEFTSWNEILGWTVYEGNLTDFDIQECIYALLYEMSFNGITEESQEERRDELDESIRQSEEIRQLPKEEQEKHYISWNEIKEKYKEDFDWVEPTEEEMEKAQQRMWLAAIKNSIWRFYNFKKMI